MRKLVLILGTATVGLAFACGYLYRELKIERARTELTARTNAANEPVAAQPPDREPFLDAEDEPQAPQPGLKDGKGSPPSTAGSSSVDREQRQAERRNQWQQRWSDPAWRARGLVRTKSQVRRDYPDVGSALRLDASQEAAFLDLLARQKLQMDETNEPMRFANDAEQKTIQDQVDSLRLQHEQERSELLGPGGFAEYQQYMKQVPEHLQIKELRSRLDEANPMSPSQSSQLIDAMYQERDSYQQRLKSAEGILGYSARYPFLAIPSADDPAARARFADEQKVRTEEFMGRLRIRAAEILSPAQLRRFDEMQEEQMTTAQSQIERFRNPSNRPRQRRLGTAP